MSLYSYSLKEIRALLAEGKTSPVEVTAACLKRIRETEPMLSACVAVCEDEAMQTAQTLEKSGHDPEKPLWGVPVTIKDVLCAKGQITSCGSNMLKNFKAPYDAFVVERLKKAGAVIVGRTNMDEFAMGSATDLSAYGPTSNPWSLERVPGGSSGGSAASVAAMQAFGSLGSDTGGSIRQPASLCGCVGLKPTYGRVSRFGAVAYASSFDQIGPLARSVEDASILFTAIAGYDGRDSTSADISYTAPDLSSASGDLRGVVFGLPREYWGEGLSPEVKRACEKAVEKARELGAEVREISLPSLPYAVAAYYILTAAEASTNLARYDGVRYGLRAGEDKDLVDMYTQSRSRGFGDEVKRRILLGTYVLSSGYYDAYFNKASQVRRLITEDYEKALDAGLGGCTALLAPASPVTAWTKGKFSGDPLTAYKMDILTVSLNLAGLPGLCLPVGLGEESGLPVGIQILGRRFDEANLLAMGRAFESAMPGLGVPAAVPA